MKTVLTVAVAGLMLAGAFSAGVTPKKSKVAPKVAFSDGGDPMPTCYPSDPNCTPPIPTNR